MVALQALEQRDLVHISAHRLLICPVQRDALDGEHLVAVAQNPVDPGGSTFANHVEPRINFTINLQSTVSMETRLQ